MATTKATTLAHTLASTTSSTADLDYAKTLNDTGVTASEFDTLDGITSTVTELNKLDGVTADATDINRLDITTEGTSQASKVVTTDSSSNITLSSSAKLKIGSTGGIYRSNGTTPIIVDTSAINEPEARLGLVKELPTRIPATSVNKGSNQRATLRNVATGTSYNAAVGIGSQTPGYRSDGSYNVADIKAATTSSTNWSFVICDLASVVNPSQLAGETTWMFMGHVAGRGSVGNAVGTWVLNSSHAWSPNNRGLHMQFYGIRFAQYWGCSGPVFTTRCDPILYYNDTDKKIGLYWGVFDTYRSSSETGNSLSWQGDIHFNACTSASSSNTQATNYVEDMYISNYLPGTNSNWTAFSWSSVTRTSSNATI